MGEFTDREKVSADAGPPRRLSRTALGALVVVGVFLAVLVIALVVVAFPLVRAGRAGLVPDAIASAVRGDRGAAPKPLPPVRSQVGAVRENPLHGIEIRAPKGALDRERGFTAAPLDAAALADADAVLLREGLVTLGGFDIDAGMNAEDLFYEPMSISFDLGDLGIPEVLHEDVALVNVADDGTYMLVPGHLKGDTLTVESRHNTSWLPVLIPALLKTIHYAWTEDRKEIPKGDFAAVHWKPDDVRYRVMFPRSWPARNPDEVKRVEAELERLLTKYKLTGEDLKVRPKGSAGQAADPTIVLDPFSDVRDIGAQIAERIERLQRLSEDPEFKEVRALARSETWMKENLLPRRVTVALTGLDRGYEYLDSRGFRKPGVATFHATTDVYLVEQSLGAEKYAEVHNTWTTSPFIVLDGTKIPDADIETFSPDQKVAFDEFQSTALHELFHVVQAAYVFMDRNKYLWFNEAAALTLEHEAKKYYTQERPYASTWKTTLRAYDSFYQPMQFHDPKEAKPNQQHGYGQSFFWEFLRDYYFTLSGSRDQFLPRLYEDFGSLRGGGVESLYRTTGGTPESLSKAFYAFTYHAGDELQNAYDGLDPKTTSKTKVTLEKKQTAVHVMRFADGGRPLSVQMVEVRVPGGSMTPGARKDTDPVYALSTNGIENLGAVVRVDTPTSAGKEWDEVRGGCVLPAKGRMFVMRAEPYVETPAAIRNAGQGIDGHGPIIFGMFAGDEATVDVKDQTVTMAWKPSAAAQLKRADGSRALISGYRVTLAMPDGRTTTFATDEPRVELPVSVLDKLVNASKQTSKNQVFKLLHGIGQQDAITLMNMTEALSEGLRPKIRMTYREVAAIPGSPLGPPSKVTEFEYGDEARSPKSVTGTWVGRVPFSEGNLMRIDIVDGGGDFVGTLHWGEAIPIKGTWNASTQSWALKGRESNVWMPMFLIFDGHLQKLPGGKLYLFAPPAVLSRQSDDVPDLGWEPQANDMELKQLLEQMQRELDQLESTGEEAAP